MSLKIELRGMATAGLLAFAFVLLLISVPRGLPGIELLQSLRFHLALLGIPLAILLLITGAGWRALFAFVLTIASVGQGALPLLDGYQRRAEVDGATLANIKVLSFNVLSSNRSAREAADFMISEAPDIAVVMETPGVEPYLSDIATVLPYRLGCENTLTCDLTIFSRTPIEASDMTLMKPFLHERLAQVRTTIDGVSVTIVGVHLSKPYFDEAAWEELRQVRGKLQNVTGPLIVAGDFNAAAWSDDIADLVRRSDLLLPPWPPATWPVAFGPVGVPIDNMFTRGGALIETIEAPSNSHGSNHLPLRATVSLRNTPQPQ